MGKHRVRPLGPASRGAAERDSLLHSFVRSGVANLTAGTAQAAGARMQPPSGGVLHPWVPAMMATDWRKTLTPSLAVQLAQRFDLVVGNPGEFDSYTAAMRQANPRLVVLVSINAAYIQPADIGGYPEAQFAHDATGNRVRQQGPGPYKQGNYLMDVSNAAGCSHASRLPCRDRGGRCRRLPSRDDGHPADRQELQHRPTDQPGHEQDLDDARLPAGDKHDRRRSAVPARRAGDRERSCRWTAATGERSLRPAGCSTSTTPRKPRSG